MSWTNLEQVYYNGLGRNGPSVIHVTLSPDSNVAKIIDVSVEPENQVSFTLYCVALTILYPRILGPKGFYH